MTGFKESPLNGKASDWESIRADVSQGSILGPLLSWYTRFFKETQA